MAGTVYLTTKTGLQASYGRRFCLGPSLLPVLHEKCGARTLSCSVSMHALVDLPGQNLIEKVYSVKRNQNE